MNTQTRFVIGVIFLIAAASFAGALELEFKGDGAVGLCCLDPGTDALFFGLVWQERPWVGRISVVRGIEKTPPGSKTAWYEPKVGAPAESYWIGVDLSTGAFTSTSRTNRYLEEKSIPPENLARDAERSIFGFDIDTGFLEVVVVRPENGAWAFTAGDGSSFDADGQSDGWVRAEIQDFHPIGNGPETPKAFVKGDVILALDTWRGILSTTTIDE